MMSSDETDDAAVKLGIELYRKYGENLKQSDLEREVYAAVEKISDHLNAREENKKLTQSIADFLNDEEVKKAARAAHDYLSEDSMSDADGKKNKKKKVFFYQWCTCGDNRVRPAHVGLEGSIFSSNNPPAEGAPGEACGCRCTAKAIRGNDFWVKTIEEYFSPANGNACPVGTSFRSYRQG